MAMRSVVRRASGLMETTRGAARRFSDGKGRVLSEEERAAENVYIQVSFVSRFSRSTFVSSKRILEEEKKKKLGLALTARFCSI
ncbi:hypothetical protein SAY86_005549 [Trapa natans]|uniref:Uncharacterized protein n=1 Tax=Trapa natans TaxID=22666 RepID=A0AAN7L0X0_TRANT|nr:hypothetical protein SAY86_005549 [Trapa natans]